MLDPALRREAEGFAESVSRMLCEVFQLRDDPVEVLLAGDRLSVTTVDAAGLLLRAGRRDVVRLKVRFDCTWDSAGQFLAIEASEFHVFDASGTAPVLRYEYVRAPVGSIPAAHLQVHGESAALAHAAAAGGRSTRRAKASDRRRPARLPDLHLPVGGRRFRPALEDVVELLVDHFGLDVGPAWRSVVQEGRSEWRRKQALSVVRDAPESAAGLLRALGYEVRRPLDGPAPTNARSLTEL